MAVDSMVDKIIATNNASKRNPSTTIIEEFGQSFTVSAEKSKNVDVQSQDWVRSVKPAAAP